MRNSAKTIFLIKSQLLYQLSYAPGSPYAGAARATGLP